jgi:hypothetical protein
MTNRSLYVARESLKAREAAAVDDRQWESIVDERLEIDDQNTSSANRQLRRHWHQAGDRSRKGCAV